MVSAWRGPRSARRAVLSAGACDIRPGFALHTSESHQAGVRSMTRSDVSNWTDHDRSSREAGIRAVMRTVSDDFRSRVPQRHIAGRQRRHDQREPALHRAFNSAIQIEPSLHGRRIRTF